MSEYLNEIEHAATETLRLVWSEQKRLDALEALIGRLSAEIEDSAHRVQWLIDNPEFDDDLQATAMHWESYFAPEKDKYYAEKSRPEQEALLNLRRFSTGALSANLLQYGKQGISLVHGGLGSCPDGRLIETQPLKNVIWQSRNQALHWEDGAFQQPVDRCFDALATDTDPKFRDYTSRNMARDVLGLLGWEDFADFQKDMLLLS
jgi:hypothetical protein